jgi:hypothetical protein
MKNRDVAVKNAFIRGPEGWCSYDYHASMVSGGSNVFILANWQKHEGVETSGCVWTDHTRWSADTPEQPLSILPLIYYRSWVNEDPIDLRGAEVSGFLRGDDLKLDGAKVCFWVHGDGGRWHLASRPLPVPEGRWPDKPFNVQLTVDESVWHHSWPRDPEKSRPLESILAAAHSYGFSFTGFSSEVTGRLSMCRFQISR